MRLYESPAAKPTLLTISSQWGFRGPNLDQDIRSMEPVKSISQGSQEPFCLLRNSPSLKDDSYMCHQDHEDSSTHNPSPTPGPNTQNPQRVRLSPQGGSSSQVPGKGQHQVPTHILGFSHTQPKPASPHTALPGLLQLKGHTMTSKVPKKACPACK